MKNKVKTILMVEDDKDVSSTFQEILKLHGFDVITAENGLDGFTKYIEYNPDLVLMDYKMPKLDGYYSYLEIKEYDKDAKIVFVTSDSNIEQKFKDTTDEPIVAIPKPIQTEKLLEIINFS